MSSNTHYNNKWSEKGVVTVYMALIIVFVMVGSSLILADVVIRQFRSAEDIELTERAFYAASSGFEYSVYVIASAGDEKLEFGSHGDGGLFRGKVRVPIPYDDARVNFQNEIIYEYVDGKNVIHGICSTGFVNQSIVRRLTFGDEC